MTDRLIEDEGQRDRLIARITRHRLPFRVTIVDGRPRSLDQNKLMWAWAAEAAQQREDMTIAEIQAEWKLLFGVPILNAENEAFASAWLPVEGQFTYAQQLSLCRVMAVTSLMNVDQLKRFLDEVQRYNIENGIELTDPDERRYGPARGSRVAGRDARSGDPRKRQAQDRPAPRRKVR